MSTGALTRFLNHQTVREVGSKTPTFVRAIVTCILSRRQRMALEVEDFKG